MNTEKKAPFSLKPPQKRLFASLLDSSSHSPAQKLVSSVNIAPLSKVKTPPPKVPSAPLVAAPTPKQATLPENIEKLPKAKTLHSPKPTPKKPTAQIAFSHMEKLVSSIDPGLKVYSEDLKIERKQIGLAFEEGDFFSRLSGAIETQLGATSQVNISELVKSNTKYDLYLISHSVYLNHKDAAPFDLASLKEESAFFISTYKNSPLIVLKELTSYEDKELKKSLWLHLKATLL